MHPQLDAINHQLSAATERASALIQPLEEARFHLRQDVSRWSVAECVTHLNLTSAAFLPVIDAALV